MAIYSGEGITVIMAAVNPVTGAVIGTGDASVAFYAPGKNPKTVVADRTPDEGPFAMSFDATIANKDGTSGAWVAYVDTTGWDAGKWSYKAELTGAFSSWEYGSFKLGA